MNSQILLSVLLLFFSGIAFCGIHEQNKGEEFVLAENGFAKAAIFISAKAIPETRKAAERLALFLEMMTGSSFQVTVGDSNGDGIYIGVIGDFTGEPQVKLNKNDPGESQGYAIMVRDNKLWLLAGGKLGVGYMVSDVLNRLGYRNYAPTSKWEIMPQLERVCIRGDILESPDFYQRRFGIGWGFWNAKHAKAFEDWDMSNRGSGVDIRINHVYGSICQKYKAEFALHPEYFGLINGERKSSKLCISNPGLRKLVVDDAIAYFQNNPDAVSLSREPSDGGNWCECISCKELGSPSDRMVIMANETAKGLRDAGITDKLIGALAYNLHAPPPSVDVDPDVVIIATTAFIPSACSFDGIIEGWRAHKATMGVYDYFSVYLWSYDKPGKSKSAQIGYLQKSIPDFYNKKTHFLVAESSDAWAPNMLGHYISKQILWNVANADCTDKMEEDFLRNCFGAAAGTMKEFFRIINHDKPLLSEDLLARLYRLLEKAKIDSGSDAKVMARLSDMAAYVRYCELLLIWSIREKNIDRLRDLRKFASGIVDRRMIQTRAIWGHKNEMFGKDKCEDVEWNKVHVFSDGEIWEYVVEGTGKYQTLAFEPVFFTDDIVPVPAFANEKKNGEFNQITIPEQDFYIYANKGQKFIEAQLSATRNSKLKVFLYKIGGTSDSGTYETLIDSDESVPPDKAEHKLRFPINQDGLYKLRFGSGKLTWNNNDIITQKTGSDFFSPGSGGKIGTFYFYVPRNTPTLGFISGSKTGSIRDMKGNVIHTMTPQNTNNYINIPLEKSQTGQLYQINTFGCINLMTVPPFLSKSPNTLLLPREIVERDNLHILKK